MASVLKPTTPTIIVDDDLDEELMFHIPRDAYTLAGFRRWVLSDAFPEKQPVLFLNGEIYLYMPKEDILTHAAVKSGVALPVLSSNEELDLGDFFINGVLVTNVQAGISKSPHMVGVLWDSVKNGRVRYVMNEEGEEVEIEGSPDWLL